MNGKIENHNLNPVQDVKGDLIILTRGNKMQTNSLSSKDGGGGLLILEADHKQAEKNLFEGTKIQQPVKR